MCSIIGFSKKTRSVSEIRPYFERTQSRGPDMARIIETPTGYLGFQRLAINMIPRTLTPTPAIRDLDDVIDLTGIQLIGALPREDAPPLPPRRSGSLARQEMDNIAGRLLGEDCELLYQS